MTSIEAERNLIGIPIEGSITGIGAARVQQLPIEDLQPLLQAVHDDPGIVAFGWRQFTPYYIDGEQCVFSVGNVWFLTPEDAGDVEDQEVREEDYYTWEEWHGYHGKKGFSETVDVWNRPQGERPWKGEVRNPRYDQARFERCEAFAQAVWSNRFDLALLAKFGDHAIVTINQDKITVEFYDHE